MTTDTKSNCRHHWRLETPNGPFSLAQCKRCKKYEAFKNSDLPNTWPVQRTQKGLRYETEAEAKKAFLQERLEEITKPIIITKPKRTIKKLKVSPMYPLKFKVAAVAAAKKYKNVTKAASEFKIPRRTLRGWIENDTMD